MVNKLGFEQTSMTYDGTIGRAGWWCDPNTLEFHTGEGYLQGNPDGNSGPNGTPLKWAVQACAKLVNGGAFRPLPNGEREWYQPANLYQKGNPGARIVFDLEGPYWGSDIPMEAKWKTMADAISWCKEPHINQHSLVGAYGWPAQPSRTLRLDEFMAKDEAKYLSDKIDFVNPCFYNVPSWETEKHWFDSVDGYTAFADQYFKHKPRMATVNPYYQIYWMDDPRFIHMKPWHDKKPVPAALWKKQIQYLVDRDYDIYVWMPGLLTEETKVLLKIVNRYQR